MIQDAVTIGQETTEDQEQITGGSKMDHQWVVAMAARGSSTPPTFLPQPAHPSSHPEGFVATITLLTVGKHIPVSHWTPGQPQDTVTTWGALGMAFVAYLLYKYTIKSTNCGDTGYIFRIHYKILVISSRWYKSIYLRNILFFLCT